MKLFNLFDCFLVACKEFYPEVLTPKMFWHSFIVMGFSKKTIIILLTVFVHLMPPYFLYYSNLFLLADTLKGGHL